MYAPFSFHRSLSHEQSEMIALVSHTFDIFSRLLYSLRSVCSLRRLSLLLPVGSPAPRLNLQLFPPSSTVVPVKWIFSGGTCASDETYTTTSSLTDFDEDNERIDLGATLTSTPTTSSFAKTELRYWNPNKPGTYEEHSFSDQGRTVSACARKHRYRQLAARGCSAERVHVPVYVRGGPKSSARPNSHSSYVPARTSGRDGCSKNLKNRITKPLSEPAPFQGDVHRTTGHVILRPRSNNNRVYQGSSSDEASHHRGHEPRHHLPDAHRISQLETELSRLRSQLARLIVMQEGKQLLAGSSEEYEPRLEGDGESDIDPVGIGDKQLSQPAVLDSEESRASTPYHPAPPPTPVTIPPPPPLSLLSSPPAPKEDWRARLVEIRKQKYGSSPALKSEPAMPQKPSDMNQVLRELQSGSIKLRSVPRSPGGTPIRTHQIESNNEMDACAIIARALKKKFCRVRAVLDLSGSGGENTVGSSLQESTHELRQLSPTCAVTDSPPSEPLKQNPPFGQHLLRRTPGTASVGFESTYNLNLVH
ncbi:hypothetical protein CRM22_011187 [Opisthorchis felineus]|uniref:Uncharacterized protein n=1 Tax=Opisthorchis felineus TaxID=147828 RepID=A0A4S2K7Z3_OPIFE|nr:hypothetical protein CRM22_011187 [Opisthorchis felineus]